MTRVFLIHQNAIQHYRVSIYNYLHQFLQPHGFSLTVLAEGIQKGNSSSVEFPFFETPLKFRAIRKLISEHDPRIVVLFVNLNNPYLFPLIFYLKFSGRKIVYWGHGIDLQDKKARLKRVLYAAEHRLSDALILYAEPLRKNISPRHKNKIFVANNTLYFGNGGRAAVDRKATLARYGIVTEKNIILAGRIQKRKRIEDLVGAFKILSRRDVGLILVGPDDEGLAAKANEQVAHVYPLGPLYGRDVIDLLEASDIYCMPGAMGLGIVDAFHSGLPVITENVDHGPEIMYLRDGVNGFMVERGDTEALARRIGLLLEDEKLYKRFSLAAKNEIETNGRIDRMGQGFLEALTYVQVKQRPR
jgi:glycosyltransferase involved in cell wall biosynthesis